jgi:hypothetical protein
MAIVAAKACFDSNSSEKDRPERCQVILLVNPVSGSEPCRIEKALLTTPRNYFFCFVQQRRFQAPYQTRCLADTLHTLLVYATLSDLLLKSLVLRGLLIKRHGVPDSFTPRALRSLGNQSSSASYLYNSFEPFFMTGGAKILSTFTRFAGAIFIVDPEIWTNKTALLRWIMTTMRKRHTPVPGKNSVLPYFPCI